MIAHYIARFSAIPGHDPAVVRDLMDHRQELESWQRTHDTKSADR